MVDDELLGLVYEGPLEGEPWLSFLQRLRLSFNAVSTSLHLSLVGQGERGFDVSDSEGDVELLRQHNTEKYHAYNPFPYDEMERGRIYCWHDFIDVDVFYKSDYYLEFCRPAGFEYACCLCFGEPSGVRAWLHLARNTQQGDFSCGELKQLRQLLPHLERALRVLLRLQQTETEKAALDAAVEQLAIATFILNHEGRVLSTNPQAELLVASKPELMLRERRLRLADRVQDQQLQQLLVNVNNDSIASEAMSVSCAGGGSLGLLIRAFPHGSPGVDRFDRNQRPALIIYLTDPQTHQLAPQQLVAQLFGLTPAEARLATLLADGQSLAQAAEQMHISEGSARSYSKRIFSKTGISRQAELVRLILKSVAPLALREG